MPLEGFEKMKGFHVVDSIVLIFALTKPAVKTEIIKILNIYFFGIFGESSYTMHNIRLK